MLAVFLFGVLIFILTCTKDVQDLILYRQIYFQLNDPLDFCKVFDFTGYPFRSPTYVLQKIGHGMNFFIFTFLLNKMTKKIYIVLFTAIVYALVTEIAQVFFMGTGCLLDVLYDSIGICFYCIATTVLG